MINENLRHLRPILKKMCDMVGADVDKINFENTSWFHKYTWTKQQEDEFKEWMMQYLRRNPKLFLRMTRMSFINRRWIRKAAEEWVWNYGWKVKED